MTASNDRLDWIFTSDATSLEDRYDRWAATYDADHDQWGWRGPDLVARCALRHVDERTDKATADTIVDAGCGTGRAGLALRRAGWTGRLVGVDLSAAMLERAASLDVYDDLVKASLHDVPLADGLAAAVVSSGVFTHGHVGPDALNELVRITKPGGIVAITLRLDLAPSFAEHTEAMQRAGIWHEAERSEPVQLHPGRYRDRERNHDGDRDGDGDEQFVVAWRVTAS